MDMLVPFVLSSLQQIQLEFQLAFSNEISQTGSNWEF